MAIESDEQSLQGINTQLAVISTTVSFLAQEMKDTKDTLKGGYVTRDAFQSFKEEMKPVKSIVYGTVGIIGVAVVTGVIGLVITR